MTWVWKCCRSKTCRTLSYNSKEAHRHTTRSQAVARIADLTAFCTCGVTWRHRSSDHLMPYVSFPINWWYFGTESLSPAVFDVLHSKCIGTTNLTFQGHVTSSVTWPFDSPYAISYWWSFGTKPLSLTVSEIFNGWRDLDTTSKQRSRSFILVPTDFSYSLSINQSCLYRHMTKRICWQSTTSLAVNSNFCSIGRTV